MEKSSIRCICFLLFVSAAAVFRTDAASSGGEVEDEHEFDYEKDGAKGPKNWGKLKPEWKLCGEGKMQSPIDLLHNRVRLVSNTTGMLNEDYHPSNAILKNRGHDIMLKFEHGAGSIDINDMQYELGQLHWHSPSEHTINGKRFALELHMVHESKNGSLAVVTVLYEIGGPDGFLGSLEKELRAVSDEHEGENNIGVIDAAKVKLLSRKYYQYVGSLTTPPCTQNVLWTVLRRVRTVTRQQLRLLRVAVHDQSNSNARPVQPKNRRNVYLFKPRQESE